MLLFIVMLLIIMLFYISFFLFIAKHAERTALTDRAAPVTCTPEIVPIGKERL